MLSNLAYQEEMNIGICLHKVPVCILYPLHPTALPAVISVRGPDSRLYRNGLMNPIVGFPAFKRASFSSAIIPATTGAAADVPPVCAVSFELKNR
jgi:hypothetical protein